jgi:hypothetical protein
MGEPIPDSESGNARLRLATLLCLVLAVNNAPNTGEGEARKACCILLMPCLVSCIVTSDFPGRGDRPSTRNDPTDLC